MKLLDLKNSIVVFDIDGVLAKPDFTSVAGKKIYNQNDWVKDNMLKPMYQKVEKVKIFDELMEHTNPCNIYILGVSSSSFESNNKRAFILDNFENIKEDNIIFVAKKEYKLDILRGLREIYNKSCFKEDRNKDIVLIEDNLSTIIQVETYNDNKIKAYHISEFVD